MKLTETARKKTFGMLLVLCLLLTAFMNVSKADSGPKPSIMVKVKNAPDDYYIALSGEGFRDMLEYQKNRLKEENPGEKEHQAIDTIFGLEIHITPIGVSCYRGSGSESITFGYMVPTDFHVIIVTLDGEIYQSNDVTRKRYNAVFEYDVSTGEIHELLGEGGKIYALGAVSCYILTLIFEGIMLITFGFASKKKNWMHFFIANTVTQIILNLYLVFNVSDYDTTFIAFLHFLLIEIIIFIIEAVYYLITLRKKDGARARVKAVVYAAVANLTSLIMGGIIYAKVWFEMFNKTFGIEIG